MPIALRFAAVAAVVVLGSSLAPVAVAADESGPPPVPIEKIAALLPGEPLGPWSEAAKRPIAIVVWPEEGADPRAAEIVRAIEKTYSAVGVGAAFLAVNRPDEGEPGVRLERKKAKDLAALAGKEAKRHLRKQGGRPVGLVRGSGGSFFSVGPLDLDHEGYNLMRGLKEVLDVRFESLAPLERVAIADLDGREIEILPYLDSLSTDLVLVDVWGTWCPPCQRSLPHLVRLSESWKGRVTLVGIACEQGDTHAERREALDLFQETRTRLPYPLLLGDVWGLRLRLPEFLGYPTMLLARREPSGWRLLWQHVGFEDGEEKDIEAAVAGALAAEPDAGPR